MIAHVIALAHSDSKKSRPKLAQFMYKDPHQHRLDDIANMFAWFDAHKVNPDR